MIGRNCGREQTRRSVLVAAQASGGRSRCKSDICAGGGVVGNLEDVGVVIAAEIQIAVTVKRSRSSRLCRPLALCQSRQG